MEAVARIEPAVEEFSVLERFQLLNGVLPAQGDITSIRLLRKFREALSFSEEEHQSLGFEQVPDRPGLTQWKDPGGIMKNIEVGPKMRELIVQGLKAVSEAGKLSDHHLCLVDRFMPEEEEEKSA